MPRINAVSFHEMPAIEPLCRMVLAAGFNSIEVSRPPFYNKLTTAATRRTFIDWAERQGLSLHGFDCWVDVQSYAAFDETLTDFAKAIEFAADLDLKMVITHDPWASVNGDRSPSECLRINIELFRRVVERASSSGLRIAFEPHPDTLSMENRWAIDFIDALAEGFPPGTVGILYDCCHYGVGQPETYLQSIGELGRRITHLHFSDGDRQTYALHLPLGEGELDLAGIVAALKRAGYNRTLTCDLYNYPMLEEGARRSAGRIAEVERELGLTSP